MFEGPFDLLLGLISKHRLDVTEISLSSVTDEFIAHIRTAREQSTPWDLDQASEFLLIAATLYAAFHPPSAPSPTHLQTWG